MTSVTDGAANRILMIAYHFPPASGSSGHLRTLSFVRELPKHGWQPVVLTAAKMAYPTIQQVSREEVPEKVPVYRSPALDAARHLSLRGRYLRRTALPDRWASWVLTGVPTGLALIARYRPKILWTTYPIATAHLIGLALHKLTGIPWVADFRDPMVEVDPYTGQEYPPEPDLRKMRAWIESRVMKNCARSVFVSPGALRICAARYPTVPQETRALIPNGFDEESFLSVKKSVPPREARNGPLTLLHSGLLYPTPDRNPRDFFAVLAKLQAEKSISPDLIQVVLRASGYDDEYRVMISEFGLQGIVRLESPLPYTEALAEMMIADGLLLFQGYTSNPAIPAKLYEYLRARRPIFAMVHKDGDTASTLRAENVGRIVPLDSQPEILDGLRLFLDEIRDGTARVASPEAIRKHSRESHAAEFAALLKEIVQ